MSSIDTQQHAKLKKRFNNISIGSTRAERDIWFAPKTHKTTLQQVKRIYGRDDVSNTHVTYNDARKVKKQKLINHQNSYSNYLTSIDHKQKASAITHTPISKSNFNTLGRNSGQSRISPSKLYMYMDKGLSRRDWVYSSFGNNNNWKAKDGYLKYSSFDKSRSTNRSREPSVPSSSKIKSKKHKSFAKVRNSKDSDTFMKHNKVSPVLKGSSKKSKVRRSGGLVELKFLDKSKRTLVSSFMKNSTRFSENYSNMDTLVRRNKDNYTDSKQR